MEPFASVPGRYDDETRRDSIDAAVGARRRATRAANLGTFTGYRIGLDIGNGNIGWCILFEDGMVPRFMTAEDLAAHNAALPKHARRTQLPDMASFVPLGTYKFRARNENGVSLSKVRASERAKRRLLDARQARKRHLRDVLIRAKLLPAEGEAVGGHSDIHADVLRAKLLDPAFVAHRHDLGRALYNTLKRRGWMKPRGRAGEDNDSTFGKTQTKTYREVLSRFGCPTIGAFLERCAQDAKADGVPRFRKRHRTLAVQKQADAKDREEALRSGKSYEAFQFLTPTNELVREEAAALRAAQSAHVPIDDETWALIEEKAGFRRDLKTRTPGRCRFLTDEPRCIRALPSFQLFRILQQVNNLRVDGRPLDERQFRDVVDLLQRNDRKTLRDIAETLMLKPKQLAQAEREGASLVGARTDVALGRVLGEAWTSLSIEERDRWTMRFLRRHWNPDGEKPWTKDDEAALESDCAATFGPDALDRIDGEAAKEFEDNFANVSHKYVMTAIKVLKNRGGPDDILKALGVPEPRIELFERLPYYGRVMPDLTVPADAFAPLTRTCDDEREYGRAPNPDVHVVLNRVRVVINEIIDMMGGILPTTCVVEIARDALTDTEAEEHTKLARERENLRRAIERDIAHVFEGLGKKMPFGPRLDRLVDRWKAALRQGWRDYDGSQIQRSLLVEGDIYQLDHVSPAAFGEFRTNNIFVTRLNAHKGRRLPWEAFPEHRDALLAFAIFGWEQRIAALKAVLKRKDRPLSAKDRERLQRRIEDAKDQLAALAEYGTPRADVLASLRRTLTDKLDKQFETGGGTAPEEARGLKSPFRPSEQAALFTRFGPDAVPPDGEYAARDAANIGWSTKLVRRYFLHLGARSLAVKPWAVRALRCMFNINKCRADLRNHAVDAFFIAHFDERVMLPAFSRMRGGPEELYKPRTLEMALDNTKDSAGVFDAIRTNINRLEAILRTIATSHRPNNMWNPGDPDGGSFGAFGGQNIYSFRPDWATRAKLTAIVRRARKEQGEDKPLAKEDLAAIMSGRPNDPREIKLQSDIIKTAKVRYLTRTSDKTKPTTCKVNIALPIKGQPGAYINAEGKFAVLSATKDAARSIISTAEFSRLSRESRARIFDGTHVVYRAGDTVISDGVAYVIGGLEGDGERDARLIMYPVDAAGRETRHRITVPARPDKMPPIKVRTDVLGRRLHRRRKAAGDLAPVPYPLRDE